MQSKKILQKKYVLVSSDINTILNVLSGWLKEFWPINIIAKESATANTSTAHSIEASVPQKP